MPAIGRWVIWGRAYVESLMPDQGGGSRHCNAGLDPKGRTGNGGQPPQRPCGSGRMCTVGNGLPRARRATQR